MNNSSNIFLISTPLQLINAIEAKRHFSINRTTSTLLVNAYASNLETIKKLLNSEDWSSVQFIEDSVVRQKKHEENLKKFRLYPAIKRLLASKSKLDNMIKSVDRVKYLFVGYYLSLENLHFINSVRYNQIVLLDDGIATIEINRRRKHRESLFNAWSLEFLAKVLMKRILFGYKLDHPKSVTYFSIYSIDVPPYDKLIRNDYKFIRQQIGSKTQLQIAYFLGQPLSEINPKILKEETYIFYVQQILDYLSPLKVIYIPHRDEDRSKINRIMDMLGVEVLDINVPLEWFLIHSNDRPSKVAGLVTSALPNCKSLFDGEIEFLSFKIKQEDYVKSGIVQSIEETYRYFERISDETFRVIDL